MHIDSFSGKNNLFLFSTHLDVYKGIISHKASLKISPSLYCQGTEE